MRTTHLIIISLLAPMLRGQEIPKDPNQQMREDVAAWIETMSRIQREESDWARDREVLENYKEGLRSEIAALKQAVAEAEARKEGSGAQSQDLAGELQRHQDARSAFAEGLRDLEQQMESRIPLLPGPLASNPKVVQAISDLRASLALPNDKVGTNLSKRIYSLVELVAEAEKFNQQVHVASELHKDDEGEEYKIQMVYFGLAMAYGVSEDGGFALVGTAAPDGWKFTSRNDLAPRIQQLVASAGNPKDATFTQLPLIKP